MWYGSILAEYLNKPAASIVIVLHDSTKSAGLPILIKNPSNLVNINAPLGYIKSEKNNEIGRLRALDQLDICYKTVNLITRLWVIANWPHTQP
ncbi:hypothetical protein DHD32_09630 [Arenibacter sp. TNZ]|jgi:hypothetical protein|nr:hypothetical protein [Arenibacter sp. TNZ]